MLRRWPFVTVSRGDLVYARSSPESVVGPRERERERERARAREREERERERVY